jgi:mRNA-capping enzyme
MSIILFVFQCEIGLWIDLTNTDRFYDKEEVEKRGCKYIKLSCRGHGETPSTDQTTLFIKICKTFTSQNPLKAIG